MQIQPATVNQLRLAENGQWMEIDKDVGSVAEDLKKIDAGLKVRFPVAAKDPVWVVYHEGHPDCPHNGAGGEHSTYLVTTAKAVRNHLGVWEGLDQRIVRRIMEIGHSSYDFTAELERANLKAKADNLAAAREKMGPLHEQAAHLIRKDFGLGPYKGRSFIPKDVPE